MSYFRELPDLEYQSILTDSKSSLDYIRMKNIFRRVKLRDDLKNFTTVFNRYQIKDGLRPDNVAEELYNRSDLDWVVLIIAGITNMKYQWPLSNYFLYNYCEQKYGEELNNIHHYETKEVKDSLGRLILPKGKVVDSGFRISNPENPTSTLNPVIGITNYEFETRLNENKKTIYVLKNEYLQQFLSDTRKIMTYTKSSQYVDSKLIRTENTKIKSP
jgi:hypothetical protein